MILSSRPMLSRVARVSASIPPGTGPFEPGASPIWPARKTSPLASTTFENGRAPCSSPGRGGTGFGIGGGYLPGGIALYDSLSGERLLDYLGELTGRPSVRRAELLDRLELSARTLSRPVRDYSRGMRQKIGIIQALQHDPELAILDEPTEGLDPLMQRSFYAILDDLKAAGRTIFFSSHVLSEVERVCDRVAIVRRGRLVALQDVASLLERRKRNVEIRAAEGDLPDLDGVAGVSSVGRTADGRLTCQLEGD